MECGKSDEAAPAAERTLEPAPGGELAHASTKRRPGREPGFPKAGRGRRPAPLWALRCVPGGQVFCHLSAPGLEGPLYDGESGRGLGGWGLSGARAGETTSVTFRHRLARPGLGAWRFAARPQTKPGSPWEGGLKAQRGGAAQGGLGHSGEPPPAKGPAPRLVPGAEEAVWGEAG